MENTEYIRKRDAIDMCGGYTELAYAMAGIEHVDVVSKADSMTLLEQTEKDITKGVEASHTGMMIKSVFGVIKCKINMMGEKNETRQCKSSLSL